MERRFHCTACGKCCFGRIALTLKDAIRHAGRFPLGLVWTPVRTGARAFAITARIGTTIRLRDRRQVAVSIVPTAYIPPSLPCPELTPEGRCAIHDDKPSRCRTMPFYPYREENDQTDLLIPRPGWTCDISSEAPVVYRDKAIVGRADFDRERADLLEQADTLRAYADALLRAVPGLSDQLVKVATRPGGGNVVVDFASLLPRLKDVDRAAFAAAQHPVLVRFAEVTADDPKLADHHRHYVAWARALEYHLPKD